MKVKRTAVLLILALIVLASGCLVKPPAKVTFSIDKTTVPPGGTFHIIVTVNNTGKVGLVGATLILGNDNFQIVQEPRFPPVLKVGQSTQLVWIIRAPSRPGIYTFQVSLELRDELKRTWTGFYGHFRITVSTEENVPVRLSLNVSAPKRVFGGDEIPVTVEITNEYDEEVELLKVSFVPLPGMKVLGAPTPPRVIPPEESVTLRYTFKAPYAYRDGFVSVLVQYRVGTAEKSMAKSFRIQVVWQPWEATVEQLKEAYGENYAWTASGHIVDRYWEEKYNSSSAFNATTFKPATLAIIGNASSEYQAAVELYKWIKAVYNFTDNTTTLNPKELLRMETISPREAQILITAMLRSINVPARVVGLYNGVDCTAHPITEFYTGDGWYVIDFSHDFIGPLDEYLASPYFPRLYQLITTRGYRLVALKYGTGLHNHVDVTTQFTNDLEDRLMNVIMNRVKPSLRSKLDLVLNGLNEQEKLYALFLFASAPNEAELNEVLSEWSADKIQKNIKVLYEFYRDIPWRDDFTYYWRVFTGEV
ncbi:transglutaminase domain-containing protein [Thermococcus sp. 9N3]|uniref:transglutaminase domain-containing protein n=1 Tax=Thermococcus sp. 9N3 TaxID=163002 RepID=UPI0014313F45|nr:transglutaminase domain-containing protein [Thermococcus sp. 9N3]NJE48005.1 transglutaminase domain-containing protein [Thermococcus sp. 9N3]